MKKMFILFLVLAGASACSMAMMPSKDPWYAQHFFIMQDFERTTYRSLTEAGKLEFQKLFWEARPAQAKAEFDGRLAYIEVNFKRENFDQPWNTDRARVFLLNGKPAHVDQRQNDAWGMQVPVGVPGSVSSDRAGEDVGAATMEVWSYPFENQIVEYGFLFQQPSKWKQAQISAAASRYMGGLEKQNKMSVYGVRNEDDYKQKLEALKAIK
jgi:GWxTD domain-containing protein